MAKYNLFVKQLTLALVTIPGGFNLNLTLSHPRQMSGIKLLFNFNFKTSYLFVNVFAPYTKHSVQIHSNRARIFQD